MKKVVGLATKKCTSCGDKDAKPFDSEAANKWRNQVPGWQIVKTADGHLSLRQDWKVTGTPDSAWPCICVPPG